MKKLSLILTAAAMLLTSATTFAWSIDEARFEVDYEVKSKIFTNTDRVIDGRAGASLRDFVENDMSINVTPFEDSEFSVNYRFSKRDYLSPETRSNTTSVAGVKEDELQVNTNEVIVGNTWMVGKFMFRPEVSARLANYKNHSRLHETNEYRLYPKITYMPTSKVQLYTRGYLGYRELVRRTPASSAVVADMPEKPMKNRMEYGGRYTFNSKHALSLGYAKDETDETHRDYAVVSEQVRVRYHWTPNGKIMVQPHVFIGTNGVRERLASTRAGSIDRNRVGINAHYRYSNSINFLAQVHYEWWKDTAGRASSSAKPTENPADDGYYNAYYKDNVFAHVGVKYLF